MANLPKQQRAIRDECFHPTGRFVEFKRSEINQSIVSRFEAQVLNFPRRVAIKSNNHEITYDELNRSANVVAHTILSEVGEEKNTVALMFEQGVNSIAATIGALKAGKVYLPLDLNSPPGMISELLRNSEVEVTLTDGDCAAAAIDASSQGSVIDVTNLDPAGRNDNPGIDIPPDSNAYIFYTSGSTGRPKGVFDTHRNVLHNIMRYTNSLHISSSDRLTLIHPPASSATVSSLFGSLLNGAVVCPLNLRPDQLQNLGTWLNSHEITIYHSVPSVFRQWAEMGDEFPELRLIRLEGDQTLVRDVEIYKKHFASNCLLVNGLGATECGIVRQYFINIYSEVKSMVPIGYDVEDMDVSLHDNEGQPVPVGAVGEIVVKSEYLAKGYWRNQTLTQATFSSEHGQDDQRIYRTGDLGRMQPDGSLTYIGRKDSQVKIRGHSVELADVEAALLEVENVLEAVVIALEDRPGTLRLVAYLVPSRLPAPTASSIRTTLEIRLPQQMIPSTYVILDTLPLTAAGKVNRSSLPEPGNQRPQLDRGYQAPRTPIEARLARIWKEVLALDEVGIYDRFLDLGGDSLLAVKIVSRIVRALQVEIPLRSLFDAPTIYEMAIIISQYLLANSNSDALVQFLTELESTSEKPVLGSDEID